MLNHVACFVLTLFLTACAVSVPIATPITGNIESGAQLFAQGRDDVPPCLSCHQVVTGQVGFSVGSNLAGIGERAGTLVAGLTAEEYLRQSILEPGRYIVSGYRDIMYPDYRSQFTEQDIQDLIAYLLTL
jgi:cytochrome c553